LNHGPSPAVCRLHKFTLAKYIERGPIVGMELELELPRFDGRVGA